MYESNPSPSPSRSNDLHPLSSLSLVSIGQEKGKVEIGAETVTVIDSFASPFLLVTVAEIS